MELPKAVPQIAQILKGNKIKVKPNGGKTITQPDMVLSIQQVLERSLRGMEILGYEPIFYGTKNPELVGFENLDTLQKIEFARHFKKVAQDQLDEMEATRKAEALAKIEAQKQNSSQTESQNQL